MVLVAIFNSYQKKGQFYPACMYLAQSDASYMVLLSFAIYCGLLVGIGLQTLLLGPLRMIEAEHLYENSWYTISEIFLAMTIFREEFDTRFAFFFCLLLGLKIFHWLAKDRLDYMEQTPILTRIFHIRMGGLFSLLLVSDVQFAYYAARHVLTNGPSMMIMFAFETGILIVQLLSLMLKYALNIIELNSGDSWESKSVYLFYLELASDFLKLVLYSGFFMMIVNYYGVPLHIIRDLYMTFRSFVLRVRDLIQYRRAIANMDLRYPNATESELNSSDRVCIICREDMQEAKKLPCGHLFHFRCLRSWLERQQACPICRRSVLEEQPRDPNASRDSNGGHSRHSQNPRDSGQNTPPIVVLPPEYHAALSNMALFRQDPSKKDDASSSILLSRFNSRYSTSVGGVSTSNVTDIDNLGLDDYDPLISTTDPSFMSDDQLSELEGSTRDKMLGRIRYLRELSQRVNHLCDHMDRVSSMMSASLSSISQSSASLNTSRAGRSADLADEK